MGLTIALVLSLVGQLLMVLFLGKQVLASKVGTICWLRNTTGILLYAMLGSFLGWGLYSLLIESVPF